MQKTMELPSELARRLAAFGQVASDKERAFMLELSARQREPNGFETDLEALMAEGDTKAGLTKKEAFDFFKKLESLGCGKVRLGRRGAKTRICWKPYGAIAVARAFQGIGVVGVAESFGAQADDLPKTPGTAVGMYRHQFLLRQGLEVSFLLPLDITKDEATRLAEFIKSLPF